MSRQRYNPGPLHTAIGANDLDKALALLAAGADPDERDGDGRTPLMYAAVDDMFEVAEALLRAGADPNAHDGDAWCATHFAAQTPHLRMLELLLQYGAAVESQNGNGNTVLWVAAMFSKVDFSASEMLLQRGADPDRPNRHGVSARDLLATMPDALRVLERYPRRPG